jgi:CubicO group peptidase (beta-lactamase class C family)
MALSCHRPGLRAAVVSSLAVLGALLAESPGTARAESLNDDVAALVEAAREEAGIPALAVAVVRDGEIVVELASGLADREAKTPATTGTVFPAASVSKLFTAALVMQQVEKGRLDLDAPANRYLEPALQIRDADGNEVPATVRQLLNHTSGLPVAWGGIHFDPEEPAVPLEEHLANRLRIVNPPGERIVYANEAFALAGLLAARAAGQDFEALAREALLDPLGMSSSAFALTPAFRERRAAAYGAMGGGDERTDHADVSAIAPAGGLLTTAGDLASFARLILGEGEVDGVRLLAAGSVREMLRLQVRPHPGLDEGFGLGFAVRVSPGRRTAWWDGSLPGAAARLLVLPDHGLAVVILSNLAGNGPVNVLSRRIVDRELGEEPPAAFPLEQSDIEELLGTYRPLDVLDPDMPFLDLLLNARVALGDEGPELSIPMIGETAAMRPLGPRRFRLEGSFFDGAVVLFEEDRFYAHMMVARRVAWWETANAYLVYVGIVVLAVVAVPSVLVWRGIRRRRKTVAS